MATAKQEQWLQEYKDKLKLLAEIESDRSQQQQVFYTKLDPNAVDVPNAPTPNTSPSTSSSTSPGKGSYVIKTDSNNTLVHTANGDITVPASISMPNIKGGSIILPSGVDRKMHQKQLYGLVNMMTPASFTHLSEDKFSFTYPQENMFMPDWANIMYLIHEKVTAILNTKKLHINSGLRTVPEKSGIDGHMAGIACDVGLTGKNRYTFADICWGLGIRAIGIAESFVHIDGGIEYHWSYGDVPTYYGPGR